MARDSSELKKIIAQEYLKCSTDVVYFIKKYCYISHPQKGKILFKLYPFQETTLREIMMNDYTIILKSRQLGISTLCAGYSLWLMLFQSDKNVLAIATKTDVAKNLVAKVRLMYDWLPVWLKQVSLINEGEDNGDKKGTTEKNKLSLALSNGSGIRAVSSASDSGRSLSTSLLIIDEAAFIRNIDELWSAIQPTLSTGGRCIALSTPNGIGDWYHKEYTKAEEGKGKFKPIKLKWNVHPERDEKWRQEQEELLGQKLAAQECDADFLSSGNTIIDMNILDWYEKSGLIIDPIEQRYFDRSLWIWEYEHPDKKYLISADVARGDKTTDQADYSAFHVIELASLSQVAEYKGQLSTKEYGNLLVTMATQYNNALLVVENANIGWAVLQQIIDRGYQNLYYSYKELNTMDIASYLYKGYDLKDKNDLLPGFTTSQKTRPLIISNMESFFNDKSAIIRSKRLLQELKVFVWENGKAQARRGYHDDLVMAYAIGCWTRNIALRISNQSQDYSKELLGAMNTSLNYYKNVTPISTNQYNRGNNKYQDDYSWLI